MNRVLLLIAAICSLQFAQADQINPVEAVMNAIHAAQGDNIERFRNIVDLEKVRNFQLKSYSEKELLELLKSLPIGKIKFREEKSSNLVQITSPITLNFKIQVITRAETNISPSVIYRVIGVFP